MKGIVIEKGSDYSVLLLSDGTFRNVKNCEVCNLGDVVYTEDVINESFYRLKRVVSAVAAIILVFFVTTAYIWSTPVQYINIDINPSIELAVNRFDRIIKVKPLNDDGRKITETISVNFQRYETGVSEVIDTARNLGYLEDESDILISISSTDTKLSEKTQETIREQVDQEIEILTFDAEAHKMSAVEGLSPGKNNIIEKVIETDTGLSKEELANMPVRDLIMKIKESSSSENDTGKTESEDTVKDKSETETKIENKDVNNDNKNKSKNKKAEKASKEKKTKNNTGRENSKKAIKDNSGSENANSFENDKNREKKNEKGEKRSNNKNKKPKGNSHKKRKR